MLGIVLGIGDKVGDAPIATSGTLLTTTGMTATGMLAATDADGDVLTFSLIDTSNANGVVTLTNVVTGAYSYSPDANFSGSASFTFKASDGTLSSNTATINVTVNSIDKAPIATSGTLVTTAGTAAAAILEATDADGDALTYSLVDTSNAHGIVTLTNAATGAYSYSSEANYSGSASFSFKANDGMLESNTATIILSILLAPDTVGDTPATALFLGPLSASQSRLYSGAIDNAGDRDVFAVQSNDQGVTVIFLLADFSSLDTFVTLLDASGNVLASNDNFQNSVYSVLSFMSQAGERYFVEVSGVGSSIGDYVLAINTQPISISIDRRERTLGLAPVLELGLGRETVLNVSTGSADDVVRYGIDLDEGETLVASVTSTLDLSGISNISIITTTTNPGTIFTPTEAGRYMVEVASARPSKFDLSLLVRPDFSTALEIPPNGVMNGGLAPGESELYRVEVIDPGRLSLQLEADAAKTSFSLYSDTGRLLAEDRSSLMPVVDAGVYFVCVAQSPDGMTSAYELEVQFEADLVNIGDPFQNVVGELPNAILSADFNGDGQVDIATANTGTSGSSVSVLLGRGDGTFENARAFAVGTKPVVLLSGDFNGDGWLDLATANQISNNVSILFGRGDGTFSEALNLPVSLKPVVLRSGDFNGDGWLDLATANQVSNDVSVLLTGAGGTFEAARSFQVGSAPAALLTGDFNADGRLDLATANSSSNNVSLLRGRGDGTFSESQSFQVGSKPTAMLSADFNGDGSLDLVTSNFDSNNVSLLLGRGDGRFQNARTFEVGEQPGRLVAADFDHDGDVDIAVADPVGFFFKMSAVSVLINNGDKTFQDARLQVVDGSGTPSDVLARDFDGDDVIDIVAVSFNSLSLLRGRGDGTFDGSIRTVVGNGGNALLSDDFNGDGRIDLATVNMGLRDHSVSVLLSRGAGTFEDARTIRTGTAPDNLLSGDFNRDGHPDLVTANVGSRDVSIILGRGDGTFDAAQMFGVSAEPRKLLSGDINGDGRLDLVTGNLDAVSNGILIIPGRGSASILLGRGDGTFETTGSYELNFDPSTLRLGDFDGDGRLDLAASVFDHVRVLLGRGDGEFENERLISTAEPYRLPQLQDFLPGDFNGDGRLDLATSHFLSDEVSLLLRREDGTFQEAIAFKVGDEPGALVAADFDGDGRLDFATANYGSDDVSVLLGRRNKLFDDPLSFRVDATPFRLRSGDLNGDGRLDLFTNNLGSAGRSVSVLFGRGDGTFEDEFRIMGQGLPKDFNSDGLLDLATVNQITDSVSVLLRRGDGNTIQSDGLLIPTERTQNGVLLRDIVPDGNGTLDTLVVSREGDISVRRGVPETQGMFDPPFVVERGLHARAATVLKDTATGAVRIAALTQVGDAIRLFEQNPAGNFSPVLSNSLPLVWRVAGDFSGRLVAGDLDENGFDDLVTANFLSGDVSVLFRNSSFEQPFELRLRGGNGPSTITLQDVDGDNLLDVIVSNQLSGDVSVYRNRSSAARNEYGFEESRIRGSHGVFVTDLDLNANQALVTRQGTDSVAVGDVTGDGVVDLVVGHQGSNSIQVFRGLGAGQFAPIEDATLFLTVKALREVALGQFNATQDNTLDLAVLNSGDGGISLYRGMGDGRFQKTGAVTIGTTGTSLSIHDVNRDGFADFLVSNEFGDVITLLGNGDGTFRDYERLDRDVPLAIADLDGDGSSEIVLANQSRDRVVVRTATRAETQELEDKTLLAPGAVRLQDLNGDGRPELIVANSGGTDISVYPGLVGGLFGQPQTYFTGTNPAGLTLGDVDGDQKLDVIVANRGSNDVTVMLNRSVTMGIVSLTPGPRLDVGAGPVSTALVDLTGDGQKDLVVTNASAGTLSLLPGVGNGFFNDTATQTLPLNTSVSSQGGVLVGNNSFAIANPLENTITFISNLRTAFNGSSNLERFDSHGDVPSFLLAQDVTGDGAIDLLVANKGDGSVSLLLRSGTGFDFFGSFHLDGIPSQLQMDGSDLYVTAEGSEFFTVFDLADLRAANNDQILDFEEISSGAANAVASTNRPIYGVGLFSPVLLALFGQFPLEEGEARDEGQLNNEPASWQTLTLLVTQMTRQFDRLSETFGNDLVVSMLETLSTDLGLSKLTNQQTSQMTFETLLTPLGLLSGTQPLTQLVRSLRSLWPIRANAPATRPAGSSTAPATKAPFKVPMKTVPAQSSAIPDHSRSRSRETSVRTLTSSAWSGSSAIQTSNAARQSELTKYMTQLATNPTVASELFDRRSQSPPEVLLKTTEDNLGTEAAAGWRVIAWSAVVSPALAELSPRQLRNRRSQNMIVG